MLQNPTRIAGPGIRISLQDVPYRNSYDLHVADKFGDRFSLIDFTMVTAKAYERDTLVQMPDYSPLSFDPEACQQLFDELWRNGFRPSRDRIMTTDEQVVSQFKDAMKDHIGDLQMIVKHYLAKDAQ